MRRRRANCAQNESRHVPSRPSRRCTERGPFSVVRERNGRRVAAQHTAVRLAQATGPRYAVWSSGYPKDKDDARLARAFARGALWPRDRMTPKRDPEEESCRWKEKPHSDPNGRSRS